MAAVNQENLLGELIPDVYIRKITLESSGTPLVEDNPHIDHEREEVPRKLEEDADSLIVTLDLLMKEKLNNDLIGSWFANQDLNKYLQIKVFQSTDPKTTALLSAGSDLLDLVEPVEKVPTNDIRMKLAATVFGVQSSEAVFQRFDKRVSFKRFAANKLGTGVEPKISQYKETVDSDGNRVFDITFRQRFELKGARPEHLAYFAVTSLDLQELARDFDIDFDSIGLKKMNGKIASDLVIDDFEIINQSFSFLDMQGKVWTGSVHRLPNGQFRSGGVENENSFNLTRFAVSNTKLQDFRDVKEIERLMLDFSAIENSALSKNITKILTNDNMDTERDPVYFSEMSLTRDKDGDSKFFFSVDFDRMIQENAVFGRLFAAASPRLKMSMLRNTQIRSMRVLRRRIKENTGLNKLGSPRGVDVFDKNEPLELIASSNEKSWKRFSSTRFSTGTLREVDLIMEESAPMVRHFTGMDLSMSAVTDGLYQYVVELEVDDATVELLIEKIQDLFRAKTVLERYLAEGSKPSMSKYLAENRDPHIAHPSEFAGTKGENAGSFDIASNRFTQQFIENQRAKFKGKSLRKAPWIAPIAVYADVLDLFTNVFENRRDRKKLLKSLYSYTSPNTGNPNGISTVIALIDSLVTSLAGVVGVTITTSPRRFDGTTASTLQSPVLNIGRSPRKTFQVTKAFDQFFDSDVVKGVGMDYLSQGEDETTNDDGLRVIRNADYASRVDLETLKYFKSSEPNVDMSFGGEQFTERDSIKATNFSFLSPSRVDFMKRSIILAEGAKTISRNNLEPNEDGQRIPTTGVTKERVKRTLEHIDNGVVNREDVATEICASILYTNSLKSPGACLVNRSVSKGIGKGRRANRGKKKNDKIKINEETVQRTLGNFFTQQASLVAKPIRVRVVKDPRDDFVVLEPVRPLPRPEISVDCQVPEDEPDSVTKSQEESDLSVLTVEHSALNSFFQLLSKPMIQKGTSNINRLQKPNFFKRTGTISTRKRSLPSLTSTFNLRDLRVVSTAGRPNAIRTIHGLNQVVTENQIKRLPNQLKALFLQTASQNVVRPAKLRGLTSFDAAEKAKFAASVSLDFEMLMQVEYFAGYEKNEDDDVLIKKPIWRMLTEEKNNDLIGKDILCRTIPYENTMLGVLPNKGMQTVVYDEYFVLRPKFAEAPIAAPPPVVATLVRSEIATSILGDLRLNFPDIEVSRVSLPPPVVTVNEEDDALAVRELPVGVKVVETLPSGKTRETDLKLKDPRDSDLLPGGLRLGSREEQIDVPILIAMELLATDSQTRNVEDEFISNNVVIQNSLLDEVNLLATRVEGRTILEPEDPTFLQVLTNRAGVTFVGSLNINEAQAQILVNAISPSAITQAEVQSSLQPTLVQMGLVPVEPLTTTVITRVQESPPVQTPTLAIDTVDSAPQTTITDLIKRRF